MLKNKLIISLIGIYIFLLCALPPFVTNTVKVLCNKLSNNSEYEILLKNPHTRISILPILTFNADEISIKNKSAQISVQKLKLKIRILPIFSGRLHINDLSINKINLTANLVEKLQLDKNFINNLQNTKIKCNSLKIGEFEASFYQKGVNKPITYKGKGFTYQRTNRFIKIRTNSSLNIDGQDSKVTSNLYLPKNNDISKTVFDIEVGNVNIAPLKYYFKHYLPSDLKDLQGIVNINASKEGVIIDLKNFAILMNNNAKSVIFPSKQQISAKFNIHRNYIDFEEINIVSKNIKVHINGKLKDYFGKTMPSIDLNIRIDKSRVEDLVDMLPAFKIEEIDVYKLKKYKFFGKILANFSIKGRLPEPEVLGDIYISDGILVQPIPNSEKGATIKLRFLGKHVDFDVLVPAGGGEKVFVKGSQEIYNTKFADLTVKSTQAVDLKVAKKVLMPLHEILNFIIGPLPIIELQGKGNIDINVKGNRKNPHIWGFFNVKDSIVSIQDFPNLKATNTEAVLKFSDQIVNFETKKALLLDKDLQLKGACDLFGKFNFNLIANQIPTKNLYIAINNSEILSEIKKSLPQIDTIIGTSNLNLNINGFATDFKSLKYNQNLFAKGSIDIIENNLNIQNIVLNKTNSKLNIDNNSIDMTASALIDNLPLNIRAKTKQDFVDLNLDIPKLNPNFLISDLETRNKNYLPYLSVKGKYSGKLSKIDFEKIDIKTFIISSIPNSNIKYQPKGEININNGKINIKNVKGYLNNKNNSFSLNLNIENAFTKNLTSDGQIKLTTPDLTSLNEIIASDLIPDAIKRHTKDFEFLNGHLDLDMRIVKNKFNMQTDLSGVSFAYKPLEMPIEILNGSLNIKNNSLNIEKINLLADKMPILIDGNIKDIFNKKIFNIYINSKPRQDFIDKYINKNQIYPIKIKGDIVYWLKAKGSPENYDLKAQIDMSKDSSIYHFGATIGDIENAIVVSIDTKILGFNTHKIKEFLYDKKIDSQSGRQTRLNMLKAWGGVKILKDDLAFDNLHIKTNHPTDARVFNIIFRKPNIKQGQFTSDLKLDGKLSDARILGDFHIFETNIPFLDTTMKNIELVFKDKTIDFASKGEIIGNDIDFRGILKNKLTIPYKIETAFLYTKDLDLNQIIHKLKVAEVDSVSTFESFEGFDLTSIVANDFKLKADTIHLRNIHATDFEADTSISENADFDVNKFKFNIAQGELGGKFSYNLKNSDMNIKLKANSISANDISWALFDLNNQIHGDLTGDVNLSCNGADFNHCMETLSGNTIFNVKDGKMPKLGSLEYLLKAGNLVKGGLTGLSINSVIDLLAPSKTGEFEDIFGSVRIKDGIARNIEITTKGEDLSLFIGGTYNFATSIADMEVLGLLSRKIATMLGPIGNVSINTLFNIIPGVDLSKDSLVLERINKIPGIELSSKAYRKFIAEIKGNINGDDYVTSFKWIN